MYNGNGRDDNGRVRAPPMAPPHLPPSRLLLRMCRAAPAALLTAPAFSWPTTRCMLQKLRCLMFMYTWHVHVRPDVVCTCAPRHRSNATHTHHTSAQTAAPIAAINRGATTGCSRRHSGAYRGRDQSWYVVLHAGMPSAARRVPACRRSHGRTRSLQTLSTRRWSPRHCQPHLVRDEFAASSICTPHLRRAECSALSPRDALLTLVPPSPAVHLPSPSHPLTQRQTLGIAQLPAWLQR